MFEKNDKINSEVLNIWESLEKTHKTNWNDVLHTIRVPKVQKDDYVNHIGGWHNVNDIERSLNSYLENNKSYNMNSISYCILHTGYTGYIRTLERIVPDLLKEDKLEFILNWIGTVCWNLDLNYNFYVHDYFKPLTTAQEKLKKEFYYLRNQVWYSSGQKHFYPTDSDLYFQDRKNEELRDAKLTIKNLNDLITRAFLDLKHQIEINEKIVIILYEGADQKKID